MIQVVDGADVGITADQSTARVLVDWPWAHLLAGQAQYELMLGVCWENLAERGRLAPSQPQCAAAEGMAAMGRPCGQHPPVPQPRRLGARRHLLARFAPAALLVPALRLMQGPAWQLPEIQFPWK